MKELMEELVGGLGGEESLPRIKRMPLPHFGRPLFEEIGALL